MIVLRKSEKTAPYMTLEYEETEELRPSDLEDVVCVFKSKRNVDRFLTDLAHEYNLCEKLLGLEKTKGACFSSRLGKCKGACIGKEDSLRYNLRFTEAISKSTIRPWPFDSAICVTEKDEFSGKAESFLFDKWCYLGKNSAETEETFEKNGGRFDVDTYKILRRHLKNPKNLGIIRTHASSVKEY